MTIEVVAADPRWSGQFERVAADLQVALVDVPVVAVEHVGSTSVPGLAAKPVLDIDILVAREDIAAAVAALGQAGYEHLGDLGLTGREAFRAPDDVPRRHVYVSTQDNIHVRNHLTVRDVLRERKDLREQYAAVKRSLAAEPGMDINRYIGGKSAVIQAILAAGAMPDAERRKIADINQTITSR